MSLPWWWKWVGGQVTYREALVYPSFFAGVVQISSLLLLGTSFALPPLRWCMHALWLPRPGQGPSAETMDRGFLKVPLSSPCLAPI
jgi:hypothetical protein